MGFRFDGSSPAATEIMRGLLSIKASQRIYVSSKASIPSSENSAIEKGGANSDKGSISDEAKDIQQLRKDVGPEALKSYEKLTKDEKTKLTSTLSGTTKKKTALTELEIDNKKSFISGHPYVTKGLGPLNGEQKEFNTFDEKQKDYDKYLKEGKITQDEHVRRTEMNQRLKEMTPEQRKSFMEMLGS